MVASILSRNRSASSRRRHFLIEDRLDDGISDAVDIGMTKRVGEDHHHQAENGHADDVLNVFVSGNFGKPSSMMTRKRMKAQAAAPQSTPSNTKLKISLGASEFASESCTSGTAKAGSGPIMIRPIVVAAPVATTTGRNVRLETSGNRISSANNTPPSGVLKVAAMPAPAPADTT